MISLNRIQRFLEQDQFDALLDAILTNGRAVPLRIRLRLAEPPNVRLAALALALQRIVELTYLPSPMSLDLARRLANELLAEQTDQPASAAIALALAALADAEDQAVTSRRPLPAEDEALVNRAMDAAAYRLFEAQSANQSHARRGLVGDGVDTAILLWQSAPRGALRDRLAAAGLVRLVDAQQAVKRLALHRDPALAPILDLAGLIRHRPYSITYHQLAA